MVQSEEFGVKMTLSPSIKPHYFGSNQNHQSTSSIKFAIISLPSNQIILACSSRPSLSQSKIVLFLAAQHGTSSVVLVGFPYNCDQLYQQIYQRHIGNLSAKQSGNVIWGLSLSSQWCSPLQVLQLGKEENLHSWDRSTVQNLETHLVADVKVDHSFSELLWVQTSFLQAFATWPDLTACNS